MLSRSGFSSKAGKGLGLGWLTSGGLDEEIGDEPTCDWVSGAEECNRCASDSSSKDCCVSVESKVRSAGSARRTGGGDHVIVRISTKTEKEFVLKDED